MSMIPGLTVTTIKTLACGDILHHGQCRPLSATANPSHGDHKPTRYYVLYVEREVDNWMVAVMNEHTFDVVHITQADGEQWHVKDACPATKRKVANERRHR